MPGRAGRGARAAVAIRSAELQGVCLPGTEGKGTFADPNPALNPTLTLPPSPSPRPKPKLKPKPKPNPKPDPNPVPHAWMSGPLHQRVSVQRMVPGRSNLWT